MDLSPYTKNITGAQKFKCKELKHKMLVIKFRMKKTSFREKQKHRHHTGKGDGFDSGAGRLSPPKAHVGFLIPGPVCEPRTGIHLD